MAGRKGEFLLKKSIVFMSSFVIVSCANGEFLKNGSNSLAGASDLAGRAKVCDDTGGTKKTIVMPVDHAGHSNKTFTYTYQVKQGAKLGPTVIYIPGGPGGTSVADSFNDIFPNAFTRIFVDPRGVGCNYVGDALPDVAITEANHIADMAKLISTLEPAQKSNLFLFGVSYGTLAATLLTHKLESLGQGVKATILEGVIGLQNSDKLASQEEAAMKRIYGKISSEFPTIKDLVDGKSNPFGLKQELVDNYIFASLYYDYKEVGKTLTRGVELASKGKSLTSQESVELKRIVAAIEKEGKDGASGLVEGEYGSSRFFKIVRCGNLGEVAEGAEWCKGQPRLKGYDSKDYQLKSAIYYFQSKIDPATVLEGAKYHYDNQKAAQFKVFTTSENFGHGALHYYSQQRPCSEKIFTAIYQLKRDFSEILNPDGSCKGIQPTQVENTAYSKSKPEKNPPQATPPAPAQ
jgi:pimeloyl-ACP methyl ester carboxylesterase